MCVVVDGEEWLLVPGRLAVLSGDCLPRKAARTFVAPPPTPVIPPVAECFSGRRRRGGSAGWQLFHRQLAHRN